MAPRSYTPACYHRAMSMLLVACIVGFGTPTLAAAEAVTASGVLTATNAERSVRGLPPLASNVPLTRVALRKMSDLFARQYFAHVAPTGESVADLAEEEGYAYITVGENLALGSFESGRAVVDAWMNSKGHRANILKAAYTDIGIAAGRGVYEGRNVWIIVQSFGLPRSSCPGPSDALRASIAEYERTLKLYLAVATYRKKLLDDKSVARSVYKERVARYNRAAELYNDTAAAYRVRARTYNKEIARFNTCVEEKVPDYASSSHTAS